MCICGFSYKRCYKVVQVVRDRFAKSILLLPGQAGRPRKNPFFMSLHVHKGVVVPCIHA